MTDNKQLTPQETFQEKIISRLREDVSELIPDEVLSQLVANGIEKMFFTPRRSGDWRNTEYPSWFEEEVQRLFRKDIETHLQQWLSMHQGDLQQKILKIIEQQMPTIVATALLAGFTQTMRGIGEDLHTQFRIALEGGNG